jgi:2-dehydropantoate 2-reductase
MMAEVPGMKVLIIGAGVIGSFYAARLREGGVDVTLLARGRRLADLRGHGVVLESALGGRRSVTQVPLADWLDPDDEYDLAIVVVRRSQIPPVLTMLAANRRIPAVLFLGNNAGGPDDLIAALGRQRVLTGFVVAGGERRGYVVRYLFSRWVAMRMGELDGARTPRVQAIAGLLRQAGIRVRLERIMDAWLKTHATGVVPIAGAIYLCGGDVRRLARTPAALR